MSSTCPVCKQAAADRVDNPSAPFCSPRCKTVDLGKWLSGAYALPMHDEAPNEAELAQVLAPRGDA